MRHWLSPLHVRRYNIVRINSQMPAPVELAGLGSDLGRPSAEEHGSSSDKSVSAKLGKGEQNKAYSPPP